MFRKQTYSQAISTILRFRLALIVAFCLLASIVAMLMTIPRGAAAENACTPPGITVTSDAAGDQTAGVRRCFVVALVTQALACLDHSRL